MRSFLLAATLALWSCGPRAQIPAPENIADPPDAAVVTDSGLVFAVLKKGSGISPRLSDKVTVHYTGWTLDGTMIDSSVARGKPHKFRVNDVIAGWTEALLVMKTGSHYRLWVPEELAYRGEAGFPAGTLVFDVHLISID